MTNTISEPDNQNNKNALLDANKTSCKKLKILMVAPQPFSSPRGTPLSVLHRIRALIEQGHSVDLITYPFGENIEMQDLKIFRSNTIPFIKKINIRPEMCRRNEF